MFSFGLITLDLVDQGPSKLVLFRVRRFAVGKLMALEALAVLALATLATASGVSTQVGQPFVWKNMHFLWSSDTSLPVRYIEHNS